MKIVVNKQEFVTALRTAQNIADKKSTMPILANVLLQTVGDDALLLCATDYVVSFSGEVPCRVEEAGAISVEASSFCSLIASMPGEEVLVMTKGDVVGIKAARSKYKLRCTDSESYPPLPDYSDADFYSVDAKAFRGLLDKTMFSVCSDEARFHLSGVFYESDGDRIRMVSTDSHRLSKAEVAQTGTRSDGVIIPKKGVTELRKVLAGVEEAKIAVSPPMMFVSVAASKTVLGIKLIDSQFPPYAAVIPTENTRVVRVNRGDAIAVFKRVQIVSTDIHGIRLDLSAGSMKLSGTNPELGQAEEELDIRYDGEDMSLNIDPKLVVDYMSKMPGEDIVIAMSNNMSPVLIHSDDDSYDYVGVVMPMQPS
jgi:DNA polymerase-3 subunit beta